MKALLFLLTLLAATASAGAQSLPQTNIPTLDQQGRKGDMARLAQKRAAERFDQADGNKDGKLSKEELEKTFPYMAEKFSELDKDKDGFLNWEEFIGHDRWKKE
jgi:Ca2+-binding EF-hand superfamily protein